MVWLAATLVSLAASGARAADDRLPTLVVAPVTVAVANQGSRTRSAAIAEGLTEMLVVELARLGKFDLLESTALGALRDELELGQEDGFVPGDQADQGGWSGADFALRAKLVRLDTSEKALTGVGSIALPFEAGVRKSLAQVQIDWRLIQVARRKIVATGHGVGEDKGTSFGFEGGLGTEFFQSKQFRESALGRATTKAIAAITADLARLTLPASARVRPAATVQPQNRPTDSSSLEGGSQPRGEVTGTAGGGVVVVSLGQKQGVKVGDRLEAFELVEIRDDSGKVIFTEEKAAGEIVVEAVNEDRSKGRYTGSSSPKPGWIVKRS